MQYRFPPTPVVLLICATATGCLDTVGTVGGGAAGDQNLNPVEIDEYIRAISPLPPAISAVEELVSAGDPQRSGDYLCTRRSLAQTRQFDQITAYSANSESAWPGALLHGDAIRDGLLSQVVLPRTPVTFSVGLPGLTEAFAIVDQPSLSSFREALQRVLGAELPAETPANIYLELEEVHSATQLELAMGFEAGWGSNRVESMFSFEDESIRSRYLLRYVQAYFTVDMDPPGRPSSIFQPGTTADQVADQIPDWDPPLYVSSLTYGRTILFSFESEHSSQELRAAIEFAVGLGTRISGESSVTHEEMLERTRISAYIVGGAADDAARAINGLTELKEFIVDGATFSTDSPGAAIAYKLAYLKDNRPALMSMTRDYEVVDCERVSQKVLVRLAGIRYESGHENEAEVYGQIAAVSSTGSRVELLDRGRSAHVPIARGTSWPSSGYVSEGVVEVDPEPGGEIRLELNLKDHDAFFLNRDDVLGGGSMTLPFEGGWRGEKRTLVTGDGLRFEVFFELQPL